MTQRNIITVGKFGAPHGLKGTVKLTSYMEDPASIFDSDGLTDKTGKTQYHIHYLGTAKQQFLITVEGITSKETAAQLTNQYLYMLAEDLPDIDAEDGFYITDLIGCEITEHSTQHKIGTVKAVHNFGAGDIIEIQPVEGLSFMVLFTEENFPICDVAAKRITYHAPELLDATHHETL